MLADKYAKQLSFAIKEKQTNDKKRKVRSKTTLPLPQSSTRIQGTFCHVLGINLTISAWIGESRSLLITFCVSSFVFPYIT